MSTINMSVAIDEADLNALMTYFETDDPSQAVVHAVKSVVAERLAGKPEQRMDIHQLPRRSVVEQTHGLIHIPPETVKAIAEDPALDLWSETECH